MGRVIQGRGLLARTSITSFLSRLFRRPTMRSISRRPSLLSALTLLGALGCAHEAPQVQAPPAAPPPVVAKAEPAPEKATSQEKDDAEAMRRLLSGPIAYFEFDKADLTSEDRQKLQVLAQELKAHSTARIVISGNTDEVGTEEYNLALGQRRAVVARTYLLVLGISPDRVETVSYGEERPADTGHDDAAHAKNRRDEAQPLSTR
jgi:peptidoglycan-associated lipoprotein